MSHKYPAIHNAMWPGLVGKGPDSEPPIDLDTMLNMTAAAEVDGVKFDGVDLFLFDPHVSIDSSPEDLKRLADKIGAKHLVVGSLVAPVWPPTGGGSAMGNEEERKNFLTQVRKACAIAKTLNGLGIRKYGVVRIDSAASPSDWAKDPDGNTKKIADTFREAADIAEQVRRAARGGRRDLLGRHAQLETDGGAARAGQPAEDRRLPGGHGAHAALHHGLQRARGSHPPGEPRLVEPHRARRGAENGHEDAAAVDHRLPRRAKRCDRQGLRIARQDRDATACRPIRTASSTSRTTRGTGCTTKAASRRAPSSTSAGTAACSRTPS